MKPHEETWEPGTVVIVLDNDNDANDARETLAEAAPELARAILDLGEFRDGAWHTRECWAAHRGCIVECQPLALALLKAGVIAS